MVELILNRYADDGKRTLGYLMLNGIAIYTLEDTWKGNQPNISCILAGSYVCHPHGWEDGSVAHIKRVWELRNVVGRTGILIHAGNNEKDTQGCILVGTGIHEGYLLDSQRALNKLRDAFGAGQFLLTIKNPLPAQAV